eukprot:g673.t1
MKEDADVLEALQSHKDHIREQDHETSLIRHLQARDWNVGKAKKMLLEHLKWREGIGLINAENTDFSPALKTACWTSLGVSSNGEPVLFVRAGLWNPHEYSLEQYTRFVIYYVEKITTLVDDNAAYKHPFCRGFVIVFDLKGWALWHAKYFKYLQTLITITQDHNPQRLGKAYLVNAPDLFAAAWKVIAPWLNERTRRKVCFLKLLNVGGGSTKSNGKTKNKGGGELAKAKLAELDKDLRKKMSNLWSKNPFAKKKKGDATSATRSCDAADDEVEVGEGGDENAAAAVGDEAASSADSLDADVGGALPDEQHPDSASASGPPPPIDPEGKVAAMFARLKEKYTYVGESFSFSRYIVYGFGCDSLAEARAIFEDIREEKAKLPPELELLVDVPLEQLPKMLGGTREKLPVPNLPGEPTYFEDAP